jgi:hypothetical protein
MKANRSISLTRVFVLEPGDLELLTQQVSKWTTQLKFEIESKDKIKREFESLAELLSFEHPPNKDILILRLRSYTKDLALYLRLDKDAIKNVTINLEGDEEAVMTISEIIEDRLAGMRPWYSPFTSIFLVSYLWFFWALINLLISLVRGTLTLASFSIRFTPSFWIFVLLGTISAVVVQLFQGKVFPKGVFAFGQGAKRHQNMDIFRTVVVVGFVISFLSSIAATLMLM